MRVAAIKRSFAENTDHAGLWEMRGALIYETQAAVFVDFGPCSHWLPKSKIRVERGKGEALTVWLPEWLAKEKGLL
ncbi:hypothetical protein JDN40_14410 [Rhodomicrobium vannielii ATCC 17100]|uniref:hypothetical protein n=1 Tax=Rhodomicrobium vannielii TaxID=1069 RepID=UPI00191A4C20|nr:hypothetical protein [Rhodomicrobium vannielii]MBJ7535301.1 hypothetical protein [Rhodomicrobium vannielii ATCC 17100]